MSITESWQSLEESLLGDEDFDIAAEPVQVPDADEANRTLLRVARVRRARANDEEVAAAQIAQVRTWLAARRALHESAESYHLERLHRYHAAVLARDPKAKTISLPAGMLVSRSQAPVWTFEAELFIAWANEHAPEIIRYKPAPAPEVDVTAAKALLTRRDTRGHVLAWGVTEDGETPPGVSVEHRERRFEVEAS
jgi:hypothetical protein